MIGFNDWTITEKEYDWLVQFCRAQAVQNVIEFGTGVSTKAFIEAGCNVHTWETNLDYLKTMRSELHTFAHDRGCEVHFEHYDENEWIIHRHAGILKDYDFAFVDGPMGKVWTPSRINTAMFCCSRFPLIGFHDTNRDRERHTLGIFFSMGFKIVNQFTDDLGLIVIEPPNNP